MHPSYFQVLGESENDAKKDLALPENVSEWLFFDGFWNDFNQKYQTLFGQYEETVLPSNLAFAAMERLSTLQASLQLQCENEIRFRYGWNKDGGELICVVKKILLIEWISKLIDLFAIANQQKFEVYCQL